MADYAGIASQNTPLCNAEQAMLGRLQNYGADFPSQRALLANYVGGWAYGGYVMSSPHALGTAVGVEANYSTVGYDWFNRVHVLPRSKIEFGNILGVLTEEYEVFNAWKQDISFTAVTNNLGAGSSLPDLPTPVVTFPQFTSFLDADTTRLSPVRLVLEVGPDGVPVFDSSIDFTFSTGETPMLMASGNRIAVLTAEWESDMTETLEFLTQVLTTVDGTEQRIALRRNPRQIFDATFLMDQEGRRRLQTLLHGWQANIIAVPMWHESARLTSALSPAATSANVSDISNMDFRVGGVAIIFTDGGTYDVVQVTAKTSTSLTFTSSPILNSYSTRTRVMPLRLCRITGGVKIGRYQPTVERYQISFTCIDNDTGMFAESTSGWSTHNSKILFDDCNVMDSDTTQGGQEQQLTFVDNQIGNLTSFSNWEVSRHLSQKGFGCHSRSEVMALKKLLLAVKGKQKSFYLPTFADDLVAAAGTTLSIGTDTLDIEFISFGRFVGGASPGKDSIRVTFDDGTVLIRGIVSVADVSSTVERLTLDANWPSTKTAEEVVRVEYLELCRFDTDSFAFRYSRPGAAVVIASVTTIL